MAAKKKSATKAKPQEEEILPSPEADDAESEATVGDETLQATPEKLTTFLGGACSPMIFMNLSRVGYSKGVHAEGWEKLQKTSSTAFLVDTGAPTPPAAAAALKEVDDWDEYGFRIIRASLRKRFPKVYATLTKGLAAGTGPKVLVSVGELLRRFDELERTGKPAGAREALALLENRTISKAVRADLAAKIKLAQTPTILKTLDEAAIERAAAARREALIEARDFYEEWSEIARSVVKRRDHLIRLGLAQRASRSPQPEPALDGTLVAPSPKKKARKRRK